MQRLRGVWQRARHALRREGGFTLVELAVVIAIIGILVAAAVPTYRGMIRRGHRAEAMNVISEIRSLTWSWRIEKGTWPSSLADLNWTNPGGVFTYNLTTVGPDDVCISATGQGAAAGMDLSLQLNPNGQVVGGGFKENNTCS